MYLQKFDTLQWLMVTAEIELLLNMVWCFVVYCVQLPVCRIFCLPWLFSLFVCHSPSQSWTSNIGLASLESRSWSWTSKSWSWSWNCCVLVLVLNLRVLVLVLESKSWIQVCRCWFCCSVMTATILNEDYYYYYYIKSKLSVSNQQLFFFQICTVTYKDLAQLSYR